MLPKYVRIEENRALIRDTDSMAILNTDNKGRQLYRDQRRRILNDKQKMVGFDEKLEKLEIKMEDVQGLLVQILEKLNG
jgi:hypothetical protein